MIIDYRMDLAVPVEDEGEAKRLGALFDESRDHWFVPPGADADPFNRWAARIQSESFEIVSAETWCSACGGSTKLFCFYIPENHLELQEFEDGLYWKDVDYAAVVYEADLLPTHVVERMKTIAPNFRFVESGDLSGVYRNHCDSCGVAQEEYEHHSEPGGVFFSFAPDDRISVDEWFYSSGGESNLYPDDEEMGD